MKKKEKRTADAAAIMFAAGALLTAAVIMGIAFSKPKKKKSLYDLSVSDLHKKMKQAVKAEDYIQAAAIRDVINFKKNKKNA